MVAQFSGNGVPTAAFVAAFPLFGRGEFDLTFPNSAYKIGLDSAMPSAFKRKIAGALVSHSLGLKSVDYCLKHDLFDAEYPEYDNESSIVASESFLTRLSRNFQRISVLSGILLQVREV